MKKSLLFGFAVALTLASCTTNDDVLDTAMQSPMEFSSFVNKGTKAPIEGAQGTNNPITGHQFAVWGYKYKTGVQNASITNVFPNIPLKYENSAWTYEFDGQTLRYWDRTCTYDFYAYAPKGAVTASATKDATTTTLTITNFTVNEVASSPSTTHPGITNYLHHTDLLIAESLENVRTYGTQSFTFQHVLTNVSINLKKKENFAGEVKFTRAVLKGIKNNSTSYTHTFTKAQGNVAATSNSSWDFPANNAQTDFRSYQTSGTLVPDTESLPLFTEMLMIPQEIGDNSFDIEYTINGEKFSRTLNFAGVWAANQKITYNIEISANAIEFGVTTVIDWTESNQNSSIN